MSNEHNRQSQPNILPSGMTLQHALQGHTQRVTSVAWSSDGQNLASGCYGGLVRIWDMATGKLASTLDDHTQQRVSSVAWLPDSEKKLLASSSADHTVLLWDLETETPMYTLAEHQATVGTMAWSPDGKFLATGSVDRTARLFELARGRTLHTLREHTDWVRVVAWSSTGVLATGSFDETVHLWNRVTGKSLHTLDGHTGTIWSVAWSPDGKLLATGSADGTARVWNTTTGKLCYTFRGHTNTVSSVAWSPDGKLLATGSHDRTVRLWNPATGKSLPILEGHIDMCRSITWSPDGRLLLATSDKGDSSPLATVALWRTDTWEALAILTDLRGTFPAVWHPYLPLVALVGQHLQEISIWKLDPELLFKTTPSPDTIHYRNAKVVLVGDRGVGKTSLGLVLTRQMYTATESTHGRCIWSFEQQEKKLEEPHSETREILLWDLAGQPNYRLIHQLSLHEVTLALVVFDAQNEIDPFAGVKYWDRALRQAQQAQQAQGNRTLPLKKLLVAARRDVGGIAASAEQRQAILKERGFDGYFETSAKEGWQILELREAISLAINWEELPRVISTVLFQKIRGFLAREKQKPDQLLTTVEDLYRRFLDSDTTLIETNDLKAQFETCIGRVEATGLIRQLSFGNLVLLQPELLDAYATALINAVNGSDGLGTISEEHVRNRDFAMPSHMRLKDTEQERLLVLAMIENLLRHELALREEGMLIFPSRSMNDAPEQQGKAVIFSFEGPVMSIYTTLAVRLANSGVFKREYLWRNAISYTTDLGGSYSLYLLNPGPGSGKLTLGFEQAGEERRRIFEGFVQDHLKRQALREGFSVSYMLTCSKCGETISDQAMRKRQALGYNWLKCQVCETPISLLGEKQLLNTIPSPETRMMGRNADTQRDREAARSTLQGKIATKDFDVFLCHNSRDKTFVKQIGEKLKEEGILPWLDEWELRPGLDWQDLLEKQMKQIKTVAVFVGKSGLGPWQDSEIKAFLRKFVQLGCPVIPVLLSDTPKKPKLPLFLQSRMWVDFRQQEPDPVQQLLCGIIGRKD
jgi:WD40 repeat protein